MRLTNKSMAAIAGFTVAIAGAIAIPYVISSPSADPIQSPSRPGQFMDWGRRPMHRGQWHRGQWHRGQWQHHGQAMQADSEFDFLSLMIPHHQEAIDTAQRVLDHSDRPEMRQFARSIIEVQSAEIEQMETWLNQWYPNQQPSLTYAPMMRDLSQLEGDALDQAFLEDMVMHHMGAVMMSQRLLHHGLVEHQAIVPFAQNIADTQRQEIWQMQAWLQDWYGVSGMPGPMHRGRYN